MKQQHCSISGQSVRLFYCLLTIALTLQCGQRLASAGTPKGDPPDVPPVTPLVLSPAAEPVPALKYQLLPGLDDQLAGNGAIDYERLFGPFFRRAPSQSWTEKRLNAWIELPPDKLPEKDVDEALKVYAPLFTGLELAARRSTCEWQLPLKEQAFATHITAFQDLREAAKALALQARLQISRDDLDGALTSMRTIFKMSRDCNHGDLLVTTLIACATASTNAENLEAFVQRPKAPNLYWALTALPTPFLDSRRAVDNEALMMEYEFPQLAVLRSRRVNSEEARRLSDEILARWWRDASPAEAPGGKTLAEAEAKVASLAAANLDSLKPTLLDAGWSKADLEAMPPEQVLWLTSDFHWRVYRDELFKWAEVPAAKRTAGVLAVQARIQKLVAPASNPIAEFELLRLAPAAEPFYASTDRRERTIALFRVIEALRLYAAAHQGALPASLDQLSVPVPSDPMTGQAFLYHTAEGGTADLETPALPTNNRFYGRHYAIRVRK
jgi:hypothetical protein